MMNKKRMMRKKKMKKKSKGSKPLSDWFAKDSKKKESLNEAMEGM